jgi:hypothetical protein
LPPETPESKEEYEEIVDKSFKDAEFKPLSLAEREELYESSLKFRKPTTGFNTAFHLATEHDKLYNVAFKSSKFKFTH